MKKRKFNKNVNYLKSNLKRPITSKYYDYNREYYLNQSYNSLYNMIKDKEMVDIQLYAHRIKKDTNEKVLIQKYKCE